MEELMGDLQVLWDYLCLNTKPEKGECIIKKVLTSNNLNSNSFLIVGKPYQERR